MFNTLIKQIEEEIEREAALAERLEAKRVPLAKYAGKRLSISKAKPRMHYYVYEAKKERTSRKYVGPQNELVKNIQILYYINVVLAIIKNNLQVLKRLLGELQSPYYLDVIEKLPKAYRELDSSSIQTTDEVTQELFERTRKAKLAAPHPNTRDLKHRVTSELTVRSKSEALIATELINRNVLFLYEAPIVIDGKRIYPDFMIFHNGKIYIIEHLGLIFQDSYFRKYFDRMKDYAETGYVLGSQLFFTNDDPEGNIDMITVRLIVDNILSR